MGWVKNPRTYISLLVIVIGGFTAYAALIAHGLLTAAAGAAALLVPAGLWLLTESPNQAGSAAERERLKQLSLEGVMAGASSHGLFLADASGRLMRTNEALRRLVKRSPNELSGITVGDLVAGGELLDRAFFENFAGGAHDTVTVERRLVQGRDGCVDAHVTLSLVRDAGGNPAHVVGTVEEAIDHEQLSAPGHDIDGLFRRTFDQAPIGVFHMDGDGRIVFINRRMCELFGYRREELQGRTISLLMADEAVTELSAGVKRVLTGLTTQQNWESAWKRKDGSAVDVAVVLSAVRSSTGDASHAMAMVEEISDRKREQEALRGSEERYRVITETAADAIITLDGEGTIALVNAAASAIFGYSEEDLRSKPFEYLLDPSVHGTPLAEPRNHIRGRQGDGAPQTSEVLGRHASGRAVPLEIAFSKYLGEDGPVYSGIIRDISERKRAEQERTELVRREEEARAASEAAATIRGVVEASPLPIVTLDVEGNITSWNQAALLTFGWTEEEVLGEPVPFRGGDGESESGALRARALRGETITNLEVRRSRRDGSPLVFHLSTAPIVDLHGSISGVMFVYADITERTLMEEALARTRDQAVEGSRLKSEFLATMSHEIRTPMNGIIGMVELLLDTKLDTEQQEFVSVVGDSAQHLLTIINDILDFSKMEADKIVLERAEFDPVSVVEGAAELMGARARAKGVSLMTSVDGSVPAVLRGDAGRLRQIILNLVGNAIKFTESGEVVVKVGLDAELEDQVRLRFSVSDTGIGLSEDARARLFQAFVQADGTTTRKYGGTGLGLVISKRLAELMGGQIGVHSVEGEGSTFWFTALFDVAALTVGSRDGYLDLGSLQALIVDANEETRDVLRQTIQSWGMRVDEASSGAEGLDQLLEAQRLKVYDLVLVDYRLPDMDGIQFVHAMQGAPIRCEAPAVLLSSVDRRGLGETAVREGFTAYLNKPLKRAQLRNAVLSVLGKQAVEEMPASVTAPVEAPAMERIAARPGALVLMVEDNVNNQIMGMRQLEKLGFAVHVVSHGGQAVGALTYRQYDLIFMDCQMPEMDGYEATRRIREMEATSGRHVPIVAMTANAMDGDREACLSAGMDDYITKPVSRHVLQQALERWLPAIEGSEVAVA